MFPDDEYQFEPQPFWFASSELLADLMVSEINMLDSLFTVHPDFRPVLDTAEATLEQRKASFGLLAHGKIAEMADANLTGRYEDSPSLDDRQTNALVRSLSLVAGDEPAWVLEMNEVVRRLPWRILEALPQPLHDQSFNTNNPEKDEARRLAAAKFNGLAQIQTVIDAVLDEQFQRLVSRWPVTATAVLAPLSYSDQPQLIQTERPELGRPTRRVRRKRDEQKSGRIKLIADIAETSKTPAEFLRRMDERKVPPLPQWEGWPGTWQAANRIDRLRKLIHQYKSRCRLRAKPGK